MIGQSLGRYVIESKLGEGGMGIVFKARDAQLGRSVAIKILPPDSVADPEKKRRFVQEAKAASALNHPHIVTIHDIGSDGGTDFIVMELLGGTTLAEALPAHGLPLRQALTYAIEIADALAKAHEAGIIHRDLKPANVMITETGSVKILDFGVAKLLEHVEPSASTTIVPATEQGITVGTPNYMSPEQAEGRKLDGRSDIFSFGAVLYEMVTGRPAFSGGSSLSVLAKILNEEPTPPSRIVAALPPDVEKLILRCLRKDPARRYQTMADLKVALEDLVIESSASIPAQVPPRAPSQLRRWAWLPLLAMVVIAAGFFGARWWRATPASEATHAVPLTSLSGFVRYPSLSPDGNHVVFTWTGVTRDNPDLYVQQVGAGAHIRLTTDPGNDFSPSWSPDGRLIAFLRRAPGSTTSELRTIPPLGGTERKVADIAPATAVYRPHSISWCPDSTCLLATDSPGDGTPDAVFVIALDSGEKRQLTHPRLTTSEQAMMADVDPAVSPDGRSLIFRRDTTPFTGEFHRLALTGKVMADGEPVRLTPSVLAGKAVWMPDSREILFSERGALWRLDTAGGGMPTRLPFVGQDGTGPIVSRGPDGRQRLVYVRSFVDGNIWRVDLPAAGGPAVSPPVAAIATPRFEGLPNLSADGSRLAFLSNRSGESEVWAAAPDGSNAIQLTSLGRIPGFPRWSPEGTRIAFHSDPNGRADVLTVPAGGGRLEVLTSKAPNAAFPTFSRDGQWLYYTVASNRETRIWKMLLAGGEAVQVTPGPGSISVESRDGRSLFYVEAADRPSPLWRLPLPGGTPVKLLDSVVLGAFDVVDGGLYYLDRATGDSGGYYAERQGGETRLRYYDFSTGQSTTIVSNLGTVNSGLTATPDGRTVFFSRIDSAVDELMLVENFR